MEHKESKPSFFKVLIGDFYKKLRIPPAFVKNFNGSSLGKIILRSPSGEYWVVNMEKDVNGLSFGSGWQEFVKNHSLEIGDFLVFKYYGNSKFSVKIFGKTSCEKVKGLSKLKNNRPTFLFTKNGNQNQARDEIYKCKREDCEADNENEALYSVQNAHLRSRKQRVIIGVDGQTDRSAVSFKDACKRVIVPAEMKNENQNQARVRTQQCKPENCETECEDKAIYSGRNPHNLRSRRKHDVKEVDKPRTRSALSFKSENSCFISTFTDSNKYQMTVPRELAREKNLKANQMVKLKDPSGRSWQVKLYIRPIDGRVDLKDGWTDFWRGNKLASNDTLIFEFMQSSVMQVHIFREEGSRRALRTQIFNAATVIKIEAE